MDDYKKILKQRIIYLGLLITVLSIILIVSRFSDIKSTNDHFISFVHGTQLGSILAINILSVYTVIKYQKVLKDKNLLESLYIEENDERLNTILNKSGGIPIKFLMILFFIMSYISAYFNIIVYFTLIFVSIIIALFHGFLYFYYSKTI